MIGLFGPIIFETSDKRIMNFSGFTRDVASRYAAHELVLRKPRTEFLGPGLDTINFTVNINGSFGVKPREEMNRWVYLARDGEAHRLILGEKALGTDLWVVQSISEAWDTIFNNGELYAGKVDVTLEEYVSGL